MTTFHRRHIVAACALGVALLAMPPAAAQTVEQFYKGKSLIMLVGTAPGGINDISARLVARHLGRFIPGNPTFVVQNNPGAGGLITANRLYNTSEKDGSVIAKLERAVPQLQIQGDRNASFDPVKFVWLGSLSAYADDAYLMLINANHPAQSVADLKKPGMSVTLGADTSASSNLIFALISRDILGLNVKIVRGYHGAAPMFLAMQRGELDGQMVGLSSARTGQRDLWTKKAFRPLMHYGRTTRLPEFPDVPTGRELTTDRGALALIAFAELPFLMSLPFAAPPGVPPDRAAALQTAFIGMCKDDAFVAEAKKLGFDVSPTDGDAVLKMIARSAATPRDVITRFNELDKK
jgi:tripartite-type tricarboxylate transporter receptor subunit TctC